jgi:ribosomal protein S18 acetylase RimI-like enzyme
MDEAIGLHARGLADRDEGANRRRVAYLLETAETSIVVVDGQDVGYLALWRSEHELYVGSIALARDWRGRGIGTVLMNGLIAEAGRDGVPIRLSVLESNPARGLYERLGFVVKSVEGRKLRMELARRPRHR